MNSEKASCTLEMKIKLVNKHPKNFLKSQESSTELSQLFSSGWVVLSYIKTTCTSEKWMANFICAYANRLQKRSCRLYTVFYCNNIYVDDLRNSIGLYITNEIF